MRMAAQWRQEEACAAEQLRLVLRQDVLPVPIKAPAHSQRRGCLASTRFELKVVHCQDMSNPSRTFFYLARQKYGSHGNCKGFSVELVAGAQEANAGEDLAVTLTQTNIDQCNGRLVEKLANQCLGSCTAFDWAARLRQSRRFASSKTSLGGTYRSKDWHASRAISVAQLWYSSNSFLFTPCFKQGGFWSVSRGSNGVLPAPRILDAAGISSWPLPAAAAAMVHRFVTHKHKISQFLCMQMCCTGSFHELGTA